MNENSTAGKLTPEIWQQSQNGERATPNCSQCQRHLGIRLGMFRDNGRAAWICEHCNAEWETV